MRNKNDVEVSNHGSIILFRPLTKAAREWIAENVGGEIQWFGGAMACEPRYADDLATGMMNDELIVQW